MGTKSCLKEQGLKPHKPWPIQKFKTIEDIAVSQSVSQSESFRNFQKVSEIFRNFQKFSESFRKFQKVSESFRKFLESFEKFQKISESFRKF